MDQTAALNALAPYLALVRSTSSEQATIKVIQDAISAPGTYIFTELLNTVQVQALQGGENGAYFLMLCRFYNGTLYEYVQDIGRCGLPPLNEAQHVKLRELSLLTYAKFPHNLTYDNLMELLLIKTVPELEEVVMTAIYNNLIHGRLDPHGQCVCVTSVAPLRDVPPSDTENLKEILKEWSDRCTSTLSDLERQIQLIKTESYNRRKQQDEWDELYDELLREGEGKKRGGEGKKVVAQRLGSGRGKKGLFGMGGGQKLGGEGVTDVDMEDDVREQEEPSSPKGSRNKKRGGSGIFGGRR